MGVTGIGGIFFRSQDPAALTAWYEKTFGMTNAMSWSQEAGPTAFVPFPVNTDYFGRESQGFMLNFRVTNLDEFMSQLKTDNVAIIDGIVDQDGVGRFAHIEDPEGNRIELWEPEAE